MWQGVPPLLLEPLLEPPETVEPLLLEPREVEVPLPLVLVEAPELPLARLVPFELEAVPLLEPPPGATQRPVAQNLTGGTVGG